MRKEGPGPNWEAMGLKPKKGQTEYYYVRKAIWSSNILTYEETGDGELMIVFLDLEFIVVKDSFDYLTDKLEESMDDVDDEQTEEDLEL